MSDKAADRATLRNLEGAIARALAERKERERQSVLAAPPAAQAVATRRLTLAEELRSQVSVYAAKQREREERRGASQQAKTKAQAPVGPTPERLAKAGSDAESGIARLVPPIADGGTRSNTRAHRVMLPIDNKTYLATFSADMEGIATDIVHIFLLADAGPRVTGAYDGVPASGGGARPGGVQDYVREAHATARDILEALGPAVVDDINWFLTGRTIKPDGSAMKLADSGRRMSPWQPNVEKDTAVGFGGLYRSLQVLARYMAMRRASGWRLPAVASGGSRAQTIALIGSIKERHAKREARQADVHASRVLARFLSRQRRLTWQEPSAEDAKSFMSLVQARQQVRREQAEKERRRTERRQSKGAA